MIQVIKNSLNVSFIATILFCFPTIGLRKNNELGISGCDQSSNSILLSSSKPNYKYFLETFFDGQGHLMYSNVHNNCSYISITNLLMYYDTFYSDDIVSTKYNELSAEFIGNNDSIIYGNYFSPGIIDDYNALNKKSWTDYFDYYTDNKENNIIGELLSIADNKNYIDFKNNEDKLGLYNVEALEVIKEFANKNNIFGKDYYFNYVDVRSQFGGNSEEEVKDFIIENINKNYPVVIDIGKKGKRIGHSAIAYDVDSNNNIYYNSFSLTPNSTHVKFGDEYNELRGAYVFVPKYLKHEHSNDYSEKCFDSSGNKFITSHSKHFYTFNAKTNGKRNHTMYCQCGNNIVSMHAVRLKDVVSSGIHRYVNCIECGQLLDLNIDMAITVDDYVNLSKVNTLSSSFDFHAIILDTEEDEIYYINNVR